MLAMTGDNETFVLSLNPIQIGTEGENEAGVSTGVLDYNSPTGTELIYYEESPALIPSNSPIATENLAYQITVPLPYDYGAIFSSDDVVLYASYNDYTPFIPEEGTAYSRAYFSPYSYIFVGVVIPTVDDHYDSICPITITTTNYLGQKQTLTRDAVIPLPDLRNGYAYVSLYDLYTSAFQDLSDVCVTSVSVEVGDVITSMDVSDSDYDAQDTRFSFVFCPYIESLNWYANDTAIKYYAEKRGFTPDYDYQQGYTDGRNSALTENLGVVDWLVEAGDAFMNFQLFTVASTPVTVGTLFSVIIGTFLLFFILRIFAGG